MFATKIVKGLGIGTGSIIGVLLAIVLFMFIWVGLALVVAFVPSLLVFILLHLLGVSFTFLKTWLAVTIVAMLFGV